MFTVFPVRFGVTARQIFLAGTILLAAVAHAQLAVTSVNYGTLVDGTNSSHGGLTFQEQNTPVNFVTTSSGDYKFTGPVASAVNFRRNTSEAGPNNSTVFYQMTSGSSTQPLGNFEASMSAMMLSNNLTEGLRNPFANGAGAQNSNIERIDFTLSNYVVQANDALVFFDLENTGNFGDGFRIAAFTATGTVNGFTNAPTTYANAGILVAAGSFGGPINSPTNGTTGTFVRSTYTNGDSLTGTPSTTLLTNGTSSPLNLVGILIRFSDLGLSAGSTIQGFSLMAGDVPITTGSSLVDWTNTAVYSANTDPNAYGNMDFAGFGSQVARPVPELSSYGAIFISGTLLALGVRRYRRIRRSEE